MNRRLYLLLFIAIVIGIQPVFAQNQGTTTVDLEEASDDEFSQALDESTDIEMVRKNDLIYEESAGDTEAKPAIAEEPKTAADTETKPAIAEEPATAADTETKPVIVEEPKTAAGTQEATPDSIRGNQYLQESQRLARLAQEAYDYGDYDASNAFAQEAIRYAELSDKYVAEQTGAPVQSGTIVQQTGTPAQQPGTSVQQTGTSAQQTGTPVQETSNSNPLPATYTVRAWNISKDCFWNIAGRPWVYGDPHQWRKLYEANKSKLPNPNNPNWIEPGIVLDIPSLKGETRQGAWVEGKTYESIR